MPKLYRSLLLSFSGFGLRAKSMGLVLVFFAAFTHPNHQASAQGRYDYLLSQYVALTPDSAAPLLEKFLKQTNLTADERCRAQILASELSMKRNDFELAEHYATQAVKLAKKQTPENEARALRSLAKANQAKKQFTRAQQLMQQALVLFEQNGDTHEAINTNIDLIEFYRAAADPNMSWRLYQDLKPDLLAGKLTPYQSARLLHRAAAASIEGKINDSMVALSQKSIAISERHGFTDHLATSYNELGHYYRHKKQFPLSLRYLHDAEKLFLEKGNKQDLLIVLRNQTMLYTKMGQLDKAEEVLARLSNFPQKPAMFRNTSEYAIMESTIWRKRGNFEQAFLAMERALKLQKELQEQVHNQELGELTTKYRTALAEQRALEEREAALMASELALKHRIQRNAAFMIGGVALIFLVLLGVAFRSNQKKKTLLEKQNTDIDQINKLLSESLVVQESLYSELQHRVKNNLSVLSSLLYLQSNKSSGDVKQALNQTQNRVEALAMLHRQLLGRGKIKEKVNLAGYISDLVNHLEATFKREGLHINYCIDCANVQLPASLVTSIGLSLNELITNSHKYAFTGRQQGEITLTCRSENGLLHLLYRDSGNGITDEKLKAATTSDSLGLNIIKLLVRQHKGNFHYFRENNYSCFELFFTVDNPAIPHVYEQVADN